MAPSGAGVGAAEVAGVGVSRAPPSSAAGSRCGALAGVGLAGVGLAGVGLAGVVLAGVVIMGGAVAGGGGIVYASRLLSGVSRGCRSRVWVGFVGGLVARAGGSGLGEGDGAIGRDGRYCLPVS